MRESQPASGESVELQVPKTRPKPRIVWRILSGLAIVVVVAILGSIAIRHLAAPRLHDLYRPASTDPNCAVSDGGEVVVVVMTLEPMPGTGDPAQWHIRAEAVSSSNARIVGTDIWDAGVGYAPDDSEPTATMLDLLQRRENHDPTTVELSGTAPRNVAVAIALDDAKQRAELGPLRIITVTGEPEYAQIVPLQLSAHRGECRVTETKQAPDARG